MFKYIIASLMCLASHCAADVESNDYICSSTECYIITEILGEGAFGRVYKVQDTQGQSFAIKSYKHSDSEGYEFWDLLADSEREFNRGQTLKHNNIVKSVDLFTDSSDNEERVNLVLQLVKGKPLYYIQQDSKPHNKVQKAIQHFIDGIRHAVSRDLLHLDLHGGNIMITDAQDSMIIDLASFFTTAEILHFKEQGYLDFAHIAPLFAPEGMTQPPLLPREMKIMRFLEDNPDLLDALAEVSDDDNEMMVVKKVPKKDKEKKELIFNCHFKAVAGMCGYILNISELDSNKKEKLLKKIESIKKAYDKSIKTKKVGQMNNYLDQLSNVFK